MALLTPADDLRPGAGPDRVDSAGQRCGGIPEPLIEPPARLGAVLATAGLLYGIFILRSSFVVDGRWYFSLFDDAMVSMRYAANLAGGDGLVWNPGAPPVEGYTNFLWTLWMSVLHVVVPERRLVPLAVSVSSAGTLLGTAWLTGRLAHQLGTPRWAQLIASAVVALTYPLVFWSLRGMEVGAVALVSIAALSVALRFSRTGASVDLLCLGVLLAVAPLIRPDAVFLLAPSALLVLVRGWRQRRWRVLIVAILPPLASITAHTLLRLWYYEAALPNTYYLKIEGVELGERVGRGLAATASTTVTQLSGLLLAAALGWIAARHARSEELACVGVFAVGAAYSTYVGGDAWEWMLQANRYIAPAIPPLAAVAVVGLARLERYPDRRRLVKASVLLSIATVAAAWTAVLIRARFQEWGLSTGGRLAQVQAAGLMVLCAALVFWTARGVSLPRRLHAAAAILFLVGSVSGTGWAEWMVKGGAHVTTDAAMSRYGLAIDELLPDGARIATAWAGSIPYFARRPAIDLLGKTDPHVARLPPIRRPFYPGHNKWDYDHSIGRLKPDLVALVTGDAAPQLTAWGYVQIGSLFGYQVWARPGLAGAEELSERLESLRGGPR